MKFSIVSIFLILFLSSLEIRGAITKCEKSVTTVSSLSKAPIEKICSGDLIFEETFETFDLDVWEHSNTLSNDNFEFQWYSNNRTNSFVEESNLNIHATLTADDFGEDFLYRGTLDLKDGCTGRTSSSCERTGTYENILHPVKSARIDCRKAFSFKYGKVEVSAKLPKGDWLFPSISLLPKTDAYGSWPASGEIDLVQARGNRDLIRNKSNIGVEHQIESSLHFGPYADLDTSVTFERVAKEKGKGFNAGFHRYQMEWDVNKITFSVDDIETGTIKAGKQGFWDKGNFETKAPGTFNPWKFSTKMAPFDQPFYFVINLAVGGHSNFPDDIEELKYKDHTEFWSAKNLWLPTWKFENKTKEAETNLQIDYIRVWAL